MELSNDFGEEYFQWDLGDNYDCETCGVTWNRVELDLDEDRKGWSISIYTGCYNSETIDSRDSGLDEKLKALYKRLYMFSGFDHKTAAEITEAVQTARARWARDDYLILAQRVAHESKEFLDKLGNDK